MDPGGKDPNLFPRKKPNSTAKRTRIRHSERQPGKISYLTELTLNICHKTKFHYYQVNIIERLVLYYIGKNIARNP